MPLIFLLLLLIACSPLEYDPGCAGDVACGPDHEFDSYRFPPCQMEEEQISADEFKKGMTLTEIMDIALRSNPTTKRAWAQARADAAAYQQSKSSCYPQIDGYGLFDNIDQETKLRPSDGGFNGGASLGYYRTWTNELNISYLIFDFGGRDYNILAYKMALFSSNWNHVQSIQDVMNTVLLAYYNYIENKALVKAKELDIKDSLANLDVAQASYEAGIKTKVDLLQAQSNLANTQLELEQLQGMVKIAIGQLTTALGMQPNAPLDVEEIPEQIPVREIHASLSELIELAKTARPDLKAYQSTYIQTYYELEHSRSVFLPRFTANLNMQKLNYTHSPILKSHNYDTTLAIEIPFFNGFYDTYEIKKRNELMNLAYQTWAEKEQSVLLDVLTTFTDFETSKQQLKTSEEFLKFAQESYTLTFESYKAGVVSFVDLLASQSQISTARARRIEAITNWVRSLSRLAYSVGILMVYDNGPSLKPDIEEIQKE